jgi:hypothetical protein
MIEERGLLDLGDSLRSLELVVDIVSVFLTQRKYSPSLGRTLGSLTKLIAEKHLLLLQNDLPFSYIRTAATSSDLKERMERPRYFLRDSLEAFLSQGRGLDRKQEIQTFQKNNLIEWFLELAESLSGKLTQFIELALTVDRSFYANNPIDFHLTRNDPGQRELFCHLSLGKIDYSAIEMFGNSETDAVATVQLLAQNTLFRVSQLHPFLARESDVPLPEEKHYLDGLSILGFCLEWLRHRRSSNGQPGALEVVHRISQKYRCLLPANSAVGLCRQQLRVLQSYLSLGEKVRNPIRFDIQAYLYALLASYEQARKGPNKKEETKELG